MVLLLMMVFIFFEEVLDNCIDEFVMGAENPVSIKINGSSAGLWYVFR
jgi:DNA gyrase/topoisomerase IV subunit B